LIRPCRLVGLIVALLLASTLWACTAPPQFRRPKPTPVATPERTETDIDAKAGWQSVGVNLVAGDRVTVEYVSGQWAADATGQTVDADGYAGVAPRQLPGPCAAAPLPAETHAALIGRFAAGMAFLIGKHRAFPIDQAGVLELRMNAADACAGDRRGSIRVRVSRSPAETPTP
jgi:eukaryotic-like serine/threonine-protein kinase